MAIAVPNEVPVEDEQERYTGIKRTREQEQALVSRARGMRPQGSSLNQNRRAQNKVSNTALSNDKNEERERTESQRKAEDRVRAIRWKRAESKRTHSPEEPQKSAVSYLGYLPAFAVAILKDLLDLVGIGSLPVIGWIITFMASSLIFCALMVTDSQLSMRASKRILMRIGILGATFGVEGILFGLNFLPLQTLSVALILFFDLGITRKAAKILRALPPGRISKFVVK